MISTNRLDLLRPTAAILDSEIGDAAAWAAHFAVQVPDDWPPPIDRAAYERACEGVRAGDEPGWWLLFFVWRDAPGGPRLIGCGGYCGPPTDDEVAVCCRLVDSACGLGFASEITRALAERALRDRGVARVSSVVDEGWAAAQDALRRAGFVPCGPGDEAGTLEFEFEGAGV